MKKSLIILIAATLFAACQMKPDHDGVYVAHINGEYSVGDDTIIVKDTIITKHTTFQKIRNGQLLPKMHATKIWTLHSLDAPFIQFGDKQMVIGRTLYKKLP